ncbi:hypothetical protein [Roseibium sp.]|uniref:hypothetical protein n=1 Tax=Roseibium sp. TaxID=1936156 RepID=UPI003D0ED9C8
MHQLSRLAATLFLALAIAVVAGIPMQHQIAEASETTVSSAAMPCETMAHHGAMSGASDHAQHDPSDIDRCCGGALCGGYTLAGGVAGLTTAMSSTDFAQSPPEALRVADTSLPKRPPRLL